MKKYFWVIGLLLIFILFQILKPEIQKTDNDQIPEPELSLYLHEQNKTMTLALEDYIVGTVAAEMPASFGMEALKAQAVCARTYALKKLIDKHPYPQSADLSDDINSCQAFRDVFSSQSSQMDKESLERVKEAVRLTRGEILLYHSQPIDAMYHSTCGGKTDSAWGNASQVPYLHTVKCSYCRESPHYFEVRKFNNETINALVGDRGTDLKIEVLSRTPGGRVNQLSINGKKIYAAKLRQELNLPSQWISFHIDNKQTRISTRGYGHGIGLCQYGAAGMAAEGKSYQQILQHYYADVNLYKIPY